MLLCSISFYHLMLTSYGKKYLFFVLHIISAVIVIVVMLYGAKSCQIWLKYVWQLFLVYAKRRISAFDQGANTDIHTPW